MKLVLRILVWAWALAAAPYMLRNLVGVNVAAWRGCGSDPGPLHLHHPPTCRSVQRAGEDERASRIDCKSSGYCLMPLAQLALEVILGQGTATSENAIL